MEINKLFSGIYRNKKVLVTGHTGFKGSWLAYWLELMDAQVYGIALAPPSQPNHFDLIKPNIKSFIQDINDFHATDLIIQQIKPDIIFHLAAQPLVRLSYDEPLNTLSTNIMGTANILESAKKIDNLKAVVIVTSDKCYDNKEWVWGYREHEALGGKDTYSASKGCAEIITAAYRNSFFNSGKSALIASARAGNVIGGGDWAKDRILTDIVESASKNETVFLRFPNATRPWQYVLEPLSGYLCLGQKLLENKKEYADAWNFGPNNENNVSVLDLVKTSKKYWDKINFDFDKGIHPHEAGFLMLDSSKAIKLLAWKPVWGFGKTVEKTITWYKDFYNNGSANTLDVLSNYILDARKMQIEWSI